MNIHVLQEKEADNVLCFAVTIENGDDEARYKVTADPGYIVSLVGNGIDPSMFIKETFTFLLAREPREAILKSFDVSVVQKYFPEYEKYMKQL